MSYRETEEAMERITKGYYKRHTEDSDSEKYVSEWEWSRKKYLNGRVTRCPNSYKVVSLIHENEKPSILSPSKDSITLRRPFNGRISS